MADLDIVIPLYNAEASLPLLIQRINAWSESSKLKIKVIFVEDGTTSNCKSIIQSSSKKFISQYVKLAKNYGQHTATTVGFSFCKAPLIATIDEDLQHDPFDISLLIEHLNKKNADLVYGTYKVKNHQLSKNIGSKLLKLIFKIEGVNYNSVTSFRLMRKEITKTFSSQHKPIVFLDDYLVKNANSIASCKTTHNKREKGKSGYSLIGSMRFATKIILYHSSFPLKLITRIGLLTSVICFILGCFYIYQKLRYDIQMGYSSLIVSIFFSTGLILMSLGIIGEYIRRIWISQQNLDQILISEIDD